MWDNAAALNRAAGLLYGAAALLIVYGCIHYVVHLAVFPLREIRVIGDVGHVTNEQVAAVIARELRGNFFTVDLAQARQAFEKLPWVRKVNVRRQWPDRLEVAEDVPLPERTRAEARAAHRGEREAGQRGEAEGSLHAHALLQGFAPSDGGRSLNGSPGKETRTPLLGEPRLTCGEGRPGLAEQEDAAELRNDASGGNGRRFGRGRRHRVPV